MLTNRKAATTAASAAVTQTVIAHDVPNFKALDVKVRSPGSKHHRRLSTESPTPKLLNPLKPKTPKSKTPKALVEELREAPPSLSEPCSGRGTISRPAVPGGSEQKKRALQWGSKGLRVKWDL